MTWRSRYTHSPTSASTSLDENAGLAAPLNSLVEEVSQLSPKLHLEVVDFYKNREDASALGIEKIPAMIIGGDGNTRVRFYGLPSGLEFSVLLQTLIAASEKSRSLQLETRRQLKALKEDVHIQVFVTPT